MSIATFVDASAGTSPRHKWQFRTRSADEAGPTRTTLTLKHPQFVMALALFVGCGPALAQEAAHWSYEGHAGPAHWAEVDKDFGTCKLGKLQSPIDIRTRTVEKGQLPAIRPACVAAAADLVNNGLTIQVNLSGGGDASLSDRTYELQQFHFHTASEEHMDGKAFPLVAYLVHKNDAGKLAVVAVLFTSGKENAALKENFASLSAKESKMPLAQKFDAAALLPATLGYYAFTGSLTTPPCSEGVSWHVLKTPVEMSQAQIDAFREIFKANARPVQPLNGRKVVEAGVTGS